MERGRYRACLRAFVGLGVPGAADIIAGLAGGPAAPVNDSAKAAAAAAAAAAADADEGGGCPYRYAATQAFHGWVANHHLPLGLGHWLEELIRTLQECERTIVAFPTAVAARAPMRLVRACRLVTNHAGAVTERSCFARLDAPSQIAMKLLSIPTNPGDVDGGDSSGGFALCEDRASLLEVCDARLIALSLSPCRPLCRMHLGRRPSRRAART